jgi:hypothetical protein
LQKRKIGWVVVVSFTAKASFIFQILIYRLFGDGAKAVKKFGVGDVNQVFGI